MPGVTPSVQEPEARRCRRRFPLLADRQHADLAFVFQVHELLASAAAERESKVTLLNAILDMLLVLCFPLSSDLKDLILLT